MLAADGELGDAPAPTSAPRREATVASVHELGELVRGTSSCRPTTPSRGWPGCGI
jgi:hypothetical protein